MTGPENDPYTTKCLCTWPNAACHALTNVIGSPKWRAQAKAMGRGKLL